ncbi:MAG: NAD(P)/FAD-dependent oxidoreductase [Candidatus Rokuibacteriota bacterium]
MPAVEGSSEERVVVIGAGPAGLTAGRELARLGLRPIVVEKGAMVGGLARTEIFKGFHFDMGGHRFFTKVDEVNKIWHEVLGEHFLRRPRLSRINYNRRFFYYPLRPLNVLRGLGPWQAVLILLSYVRGQLFPYRQEDTFEEWVTNRFGRRLFRIFFKTYTEKVWGIPCSELRAEWAAQRIKNLSLKAAVLSMFLKPRRTIKTLIEEFDYPRLGPGMMWNAVAREIRQQQGAVRLHSEVVALRRTGLRIDGIVVSTGGREEIIAGTHFISSMPVSELVQKLTPPAPAPVLEAARRLSYRDFLTVCLIVNRPNLFPDSWIYVHSPEVTVGRIQNFKNWSPDMVPDPSKTSLGLEYFCSEGDAVWSTPDADLVELGKRELEQIGLVHAGDVEDGCVFRVSKAYPIYDAGYRDALATVRKFVDSLLNLQTVGRNGLHRYNNQDHAMLTGLLAVRNLTRGERNDLWSVNVDQEYHEEEVAALPDRERAEIGAGLGPVFHKLDGVALGGAAGVLGGMLLCLATLVLVLKGGDEVGPRLGLLAQYFPGYTVTGPGSLLGGAYGFIVGFLGGLGFAVFRNAALFLSMAILQRRAQLHLVRRFLDFI